MKSEILYVIGSLSVSSKYCTWTESCLFSRTIHLFHPESFSLPAVVVSLSVVFTRQIESGITLAIFLSRTVNRRFRLFPVAFLSGLCFDLRLRLRTMALSTKKSTHVHVSRLALEMALKSG